MEVIPVLDLLDGVVVHGVAGRRDEYRPVESLLVEGSSPVAVATALQQAADAAALYIADLDAIEGVGDNLPAIRSIADAVPAALWVDAGVATTGAAHALLEAAAARVIVGTETLPSPSHLTRLRRGLGDERLLLSLDMFRGVVRSAAAELDGLEPRAALGLLAAESLPAVLVLPVDRVGTAGGPDIATLALVRRTLPGTYLVAGGGVRDGGDLHGLEEAGADAVLVASALHRGSVTAADVAALSRR